MINTHRFRYLALTAVLTLGPWATSTFAATTGAASAQAGKALIAERIRVHRPAELDEVTRRGRFLVAFETDGARAGQLAAALRRDYDIELLGTWSRALAGALVECDLATARRLAADPRVAFIEQDVTITAPTRVAGGERALLKGADGPPHCFFEDDGSFRPSPYPDGSSTIAWGPSCPGAASCIGNWGLDRIDDRSGLDGSFHPPGGDSLVDLFVLDSGIALSHAELDQLHISEVLLGTNALEPDFHGTHVAGIAAGKNFGVARGTVRFTSLNLGSNRADPLFTSWIIDGFEEALERRQPGAPAVVTMSINADFFPSSRILAQVVRQAIVEKIVVVNSAGNLKGSDLPMPTCTATPDAEQRAEHFTLSGNRYPPEVLVVGASDSDDRIYCECVTADENDCASRVGLVDLYAPGADIVSMSALDEEAICRLSGTSMAAPHVAGAAALLLSRFPQASPAAIERALIRASTKHKLSSPNGGDLERNRLLYVGAYTAKTPVAGHQFVFARAGKWDTLAKSDLVADDIDWRGLALSVTAIDDAKKVKLVDNGATIKFRVDDNVAPSRDIHSSASFRYTVSNGLLNYDGELLTDVARVRFIVLAEPGDDYFPFGGAGAVDIDLGELLVNDGLDLEEVTCQAPRTASTSGTVSQRWAGGGCVGYRYFPPFAGFAGTDTFDYVLRLTGGVEVSARVFVHYNDPAVPTSINGEALANYPFHNGVDSVEVPTGAYLIAWPTSPHTGIIEYQLIETDRATGQSTTVYTGPRTFHALSGRTPGTREYRVLACTAVACSQPSGIDTVGFGAKSVVKTLPESCENGDLCNPRRGLWHDPSRSGNGIDLQKDAAGRWQILLFTYRRADATPIWYRATPARISDRKLVAVLEELRSTGGGALGTSVVAEPYGFLEIDFWSTSSSLLNVYRFDQPMPREHGFENPVFTGSFQHLAGAPSGADGQWRPSGGAAAGLVLTQAPSAAGSTAFSTTHFFRPDGSPTWLSTLSGTLIAQPWQSYSGSIRPLFRRGFGLCLECNGPWWWQDTHLPYSIYVDIPNVHGAGGTANIDVTIPVGVDPAFDAGYSFAYSGGLSKVTD